MSMRKKWQNETYRKAQKSVLAMSEQKKQHLSTVMKELWRNGTLKKQRPGKISEAHKQRISEAIQKKWADKEYRRRVISGIQGSTVNRSRRTLSNATRQKLKMRSLEYWNNVKNGSVSRDGFNPDAFYLDEGFEGL